MRSTIEIIDPKTAIEMLKKNQNNRPLSKARYEKYARSIERGEWQTNGDAIRFSKNGNLLDGQHRLNAIIKSGIAVRTLVIYDLDESVFKTIDQGAKRTTGDLLSLSGFKNSNSLAATIILFFKYQKYGDPFFGGNEKNPSQDQIFETIEKNPDIQRYVDFCAKTKIIKAMMSPSSMSFCYYAFALHDSDKADSFFDYLQNPSNDGNAGSIIRERFIQERLGKQKIDNKYMTKLMFKAFRYFINNVKPKTLRITESGTSEEKDLFNLLKK